MAQSLAAFFEDDGLLLKKFVFRVKPEEGLKKVEPVVRRIAAARAPDGRGALPVAADPARCPAAPVLLLGIARALVPRPRRRGGGRAAARQPVHVAVRPAAQAAGGRLGIAGSLAWWATRRTPRPPSPTRARASTSASGGLDLVRARHAHAGAAGRAARRRCARRCDQYTSQGSKDEKIYVLNLEYMAQNFDPKEAERILRTAARASARTSRRWISCAPRRTCWATTRCARR